MCGIVGYVGDRPCRDLLIAGLEKLEYRGYDSAGVSVISDGEIDSVRAVGNLANLREALEQHLLERRRRRRGRRAAGDHRARPHALGDPRPGHRGERPPPRRLQGQHPHRPQRDHREPRRAAAGPEGRGPRVHLRDRRRDRQPPDRAPLRRGPDRGRAEGLRGAAGALRVRRHAPRAAGHPGRGAQGVPADHRPGRERELHRLRDPRLPGPDAHRPRHQERRDRHGPQGRRDDHRRRRQRAGARARGGHLGRGRRREGRLRDLHAEGDPRAAGRGRGDDHRPAADAGRRRPLRRRARRRLPARHRADRDRRLRDLLPLGPDRPLRDRAVGAGPGRDGHRLRVPLPRAGPPAERPGHRDHPVGRDRRHARRDAAGP